MQPSINFDYHTDIKAPTDVAEGFVGHFDETMDDNIYAVHDGMLWGPFDLEVEAMDWVSKQRGMSDV